MKRFVVALLLALLAWSPRAGASELTLDETVRSAVASHPLLAAAEKERAMAAGELLSAEGGFDPTVRARGLTIPFGPYPYDTVDFLVEQPTSAWGARLFGGWRYGRGSIPVYEGKLATADYGEVRGGVSLPLLRDGAIDRRRAAIAKAELAKTLAGLSVEQQRIEIVRAASQRYWDWVAAGRRAEIARDLLDAAKTRDAALRARAEQGDLPAIERVENERAIHQRAAQLAAAQRALESAAIELSLFFRSPDGEPRVPDVARLPTALPEPSGIERVDERAAIDRRPEPKRLATAARQAAIDEELANNQKKVGLELTVAGSQDIGRAVDPRMTKPQLEIMAVLDIPILNRTADGRADAASAARARANLQARWAEDRVVADVRDAASAIDQAHRRFDAARREVTVAGDLVDLERRRFELGEGTLLLVNLREQALGEARLRELDAVADFHKAVASYKAATGTTRR